jgi:hypothetical protein
MEAPHVMIEPGKVLGGGSSINTMGGCVAIGERMGEILRAR